MAAAGGLVLTETGAFGVALVDTEVVSLTGGRGGKIYVADEAFGIVAVHGAVVGTAVGAWVCHLGTG